MAPLSYIRRLLGEGPQYRGIDLSLPYYACKILAVDIETNSLEVKLGDILSLGWVLIDNGEINLASCRHLYIDSTAVSGESTKIHGIRDIDRKGGHSLRDALEELYQTSSESVLLFHHAGFDLKFLNAASVKTGLPALRMPFVDTLLLEQRRKVRSGVPIAPGAMTLAACRKRYALPPAPEHDALEDALATAELALAMFSAISGTEPVPIKYFTQTSKYI